jgi:hypothetical protein
LLLFFRKEDLPFSPKKKASMFFSEEKNQKTFASSLLHVRGLGGTGNGG